MTEDSRSARHITGDTTRRGALAGLGVAGVAVVVTACGGGSSGSSTGSSGSGGSSSGTSLGAISDIPVGGGKIFTADKVVVTQPAAGEFKGFSAVCTHMGCIVDKIADGTIDCPCHGSKYSITDAHVVHGPAPKPLPVKNIKVANGKISLA
ncbi:MAG TPA: Rieske (2Fe-2S) protein [Streptosporangiaceae bacterium]|nr:Rieske (2Fe-2S) protein [Streptosporangiaceae bacterium]